MVVEVSQLCYAPMEATGLDLKISVLNLVLNKR